MATTKERQKKDGARSFPAVIRKKKRRKGCACVAGVIRDSLARDAAAFFDMDRKLHHGRGGAVPGTGTRPDRIETGPKFQDPAWHREITDFP